MKKNSMQEDLNKAQLVDFIDYSQPGIAIQFCLDTTSLTGFYSDELACYRARRVWKTVFERTFLLKSECDFIMETESSEEGQPFSLRCFFNSPSGRYALWRLANDQAPESQYTIETAHVPDSEAMHEQLISAPDLVAAGSSPTILHAPDETTRLIKNICDKIKQLTEKINLKS